MRVDMRYLQKSKPNGLQVEKEEIYMDSLTAVIPHFFDRIVDGYLYHPDHFQMGRGAKSRWIAHPGSGQEVIDMVRYENWKTVKQGRGSRPDCGERTLAEEIWPSQE